MSFKAVIPLLDHRDKDVRENGKKLIIESYRWIGVMMKSQLTGVKPVQVHINCSRSSVRIYLEFY